MNAHTPHPYDYFQALERLRDCYAELDATERARLKTIVALNASDPRAVALVADISGDDWAHIYPPVPKEAQISTAQTIDIFLGTYGNSSPKEEAVLEKLIFNPVPDYSSVLEQQEREEQSDIIEQPHGLAPDSDAVDDIEKISALAKSINGSKEQDSSPVEESQKHDSEPKPTQGRLPGKGAQHTPMTLELAKIFVKQGRFDRAHEIISKIILNNPEKSVYFADQLRFLEKLIKIKNAQSGN